MELHTFINMIKRNWIWLVAVPIVVALSIYFLMGRKEKQYSSSMHLYTGFASGYNVSSEGAKADFFTVNNLLDNLINTIKSNTVLSKVALKLFAGSLIEGKAGNDKFISPKSYQALLKIVPPDVMALVDYSSVDSTVMAMEAYMNRDTKNFVYELLNLYHPDYSLWALNKLNVSKIGNSDLINISYECGDPGLCYETLNILSHEFIDSYRNLSLVKTDEVVQYFERELAKSSDRLKGSEDAYMEYSKDHQVINYYEQTKSIAGQLQAFELDYDQVLARNAMAKRSMQVLEGKIGLNTLMRLKSQSVLDARRRLATDAYNSTTQNLFLDDSSYVRFNSSVLNDQIRKGELAIHATLDTMDIYNSTPEGVDMDNVLVDWMTNAVAYDATLAALKVLDGRRKLILEKFEFYAPVGATVKRDERQINVNEREYLSLLSSLALAKLRIQEIAMSSSSLRIVDEPQYPINAEPGKRKVLTIAGFLAAFLLVLMILVVIEFTDHRLRDAVRAARLTALRVVGVLPVYGRKRGEDRGDYAAVEYLIAQIIRLAKTGFPLKINVLPSADDSQKDSFVDLLQQNFSRLGYSVRLIVSGRDFDPYNKSYIDAFSVVNLVPSDEKQFDVYITLLPGLGHGVAPTSILSNSSINLMVACADKVWHNNDQTALQFLAEQQSVNPIYLVLLEADSLAVNYFIGKQPQSHSLKS